MTEGGGQRGRKAQDEGRTVPAEVSEHDSGRARHPPPSFGRVSSLQCATSDVKLGEPLELPAPWELTLDTARLSA